MTTATFEGNIYEDGNQYKDDDKLAVKFEMRAIPLVKESEKEGRPMFKDIPYIYIITPGSRDIMATEATPEYQRRFKKQWENFLAREATPETGTPLAEVPWLSKSQVAEMNANNVRTVEQLANLPDNLSNGVMGYHMLKDRAKRYLEAAAGEAPMLQLEAKLKERDAKIEAQQAQIEELIQQVKLLMPPGKKAA